MNSLFLNCSPYLSPWEKAEQVLQGKSIYYCQYYMDKDKYPFLYIRVKENNDGSFEPLVTFVPGGNRLIASGPSCNSLEQGQRRAEYLAEKSLEHLSHEFTKILINHLPNPLYTGTSIP